MSKHHRKYWFAAKSYGWGWGLPSAWQGWTVFAVFITALSILPFAINPNEQLTLFIILSLNLALGFLGICYVKGEPLKWRWGSAKRKQK